jgi:hypothetical protein
MEKYLRPNLVTVLEAHYDSRAGLPDFSWYMIPKPKKVPNEHKKYQMSVNIPKGP